MLPNLHGVSFLINTSNSSLIRKFRIQLKETQANLIFTTNMDQAIEIVEKGQTQVVFSYFDLTYEEEANNFLKKFLKYSPSGLFYFYKNKVDYPDVIQAIKKGAANFLSLPINWNDVLQEIATKLSSRSTQLAKTSEDLKKLQYFLIFRSEKMKKSLEFLPKIASTDYNVLIVGETGTGKEMVSRAIHALSNRNQGPFIAVNCGAIPENLIESELFGYEKGSFTGATSMKKGKFELANYGTLLLDEIGDMPLNLQTKLLRILEEKQVFRIGSDKGVPIDVRVLAATNVNLNRSITEKIFRDDLYYRLSTLNVSLPALRNRKEDISLLAWHFLQKVLREIHYEPPYPYLSEESIELLEKQPWYGNIRELRNIITQLAVLLPANTRVIEASRIRAILSDFTRDLDFSNNDELDIDSVKIPLSLSLNEVKDLYIQKVLDSKQGNKTKTAQSLKISVRSLRQRVNI